MRQRMNPDLEKLVHLQKAASQLQKVESDLAEVPKDKETLAARLSQERGRLDAVRDGLQASQKARKQYETELQDLEQKRSKYKGQLMDVKTNKEYTAMLHEIEAVEREIRGREDLVLGEMEKAEGLAAETKREELEWKAVEEGFRTESKALDQRAEGLKQDADRLRGERDQVAASISGPAIDLYNRVARLRGVAVAEAKDGTCQVCHVKLRLQMYSELKRNEEIAQCPSCNRILFFDPQAAAVSSQP